MAKTKYPGLYEAEQEHKSSCIRKDEEPDWIAGAPNYDKYPGFTAEEILVMFNID